MIEQGLSIATEHCYRALRLAMRLVRPRTDGRNGLTKKVVLFENNSHVSNAREIRSDSASSAATRPARYAAVTS